MKIIIVPDMHGSDAWKNAIRMHDENPDAYVVSLGDWFDSWTNAWPEQGDNFKEAVNWFGANENRVMLIGNHDFAYITTTKDGKRVSGHQWRRELEIKYLMESNIEMFKVGVELDGWVLSHAGFTKTWSEIIEDYYRNEENNNLNILDLINREFSNRFSEPYYNSIDMYLDWHGSYSSTGDEPIQGPLWVRPRSLISDSMFGKQIVGHTEIAGDYPVKIDANGTKVILTDNVKRSIYMFDTKNIGEFEII